MNCPICRVGMIVVEYREVELDHCVECGGIWFDREEFEFMLENMNLSIENLNMKTPSRDKNAAGKEEYRRCPLCKKRMRKLSVGEDSSIIIDKCGRHGGYWFDKGELRRAVRGNPSDAEWKNVIGFLEGCFLSDMIEREESQ